MADLDLNGPWTLYYRGHAERECSTLEEAIEAGYDRVEAIVPGNVELDLMRAGELDDVYIGTGITRAWELEYGDWWYTRDFDLPPDWPADAVPTLVFEGLDTVAEVFVNGELVARPTNMLVPHEVELSEPRPTGNVLTVHIGSALRYAERFDYPPLYRGIEPHPEALWVRKAPHTYGWDVAGRFVSGGIWRPVRIEARTRPRISELYVHTERLTPDHGTATLRVHYVLSDAPRGRRYRLRVEGRHAPSGHTFTAEHDVRFKAGDITIEVADPRLWWPRGYGQAALYDTVVAVVHDETVSHRWPLRVGIRQVTVDHLDRPGRRGRLSVSVNHEPIQLMGPNWTPVDVLHSRDHERLPAVLDLLDDVGGNAVRCWGGNVYEDDLFFDWCDDHGVLVWQDFALACGRYPQEEPFLSALAAEAEAIVERLRNHASLFLWCGNNENDDSYVVDGLDPNTDVTSRRVLRDAVARQDPGRAYLPGSPFYGPALWESGDLASPDRHLWGQRADYKAPFYTDTGVSMVSEVGFAGSPALESLRVFIPADRMNADPEDLVWRLHETDDLVSDRRGYSRIRLMIDQAERLFGDVAGDLPSLVAASQIAQAEALKHVVESSRIAKPHRAGVLWWNLIDPWPQISDSVVDYYFRPKLAYHYLKRAQTPVWVMLDEADGWRRDVVLANDTRLDARVTFRISDSDTGERLSEGTGEAPARHNAVIGRLPISTRGRRCLLIEWTHDDRRLGNHYLEAAWPLDLAEYRDRWLPEIASLNPAIPLTRPW